MAGLVDILAGGSPLAPEETEASIASTLASDPSRLASSSNPVGQALGQISGGFYQQQAIDAARQIAQAHTDALPALGRAYSSDNPWQTIANDPDAPAYAKWQILNQSPTEVANAKDAYARAGLFGAEAQKAQILLERLRSGQGLPPGAAPAPGTRPSASAAPSPTGAAAANAPFQFPGRPAAAPTPAAPAPTAAATSDQTAPAVDTSQMPAAPTPEARSAMATNMTPAELYQLRRQLALRSAQMKAQGLAAPRAG